jgi:hypothetical protein
VFINDGVVVEEDERGAHSPHQRLAILPLFQAPPAGAVEVERGAGPVSAAGRVAVGLPSLRPPSAPVNESRRGTAFHGAPPRHTAPRSETAPLSRLPSQQADVQASLPSIGAPSLGWPQQTPSVAWPTPITTSAHGRWALGQAAALGAAVPGARGPGRMDGQSG